MLEHNKKHGIIAVVGAPNAGKSTLTNALLGQKLAIVSPKVQTTRNSLRAIAIFENKQIILIDTPGIFIPRDDKILERIIVKTAWQALREADHICFVIDANIGVNLENMRILKDLQKENLGITVIINKIDVAKEVKTIPLISALSQLGIQDIIPVSALTNEGIDNLKNFLTKFCLKDGWLYNEEDITDASMRFIASEITREKLFLNLHKELPYSLAVKTDNYENLADGSVKINQTIFVLKESQKTIIVGKRGEMIKKIGQQAREDIGQIAGCKIHLFLFVKVKNDWMRDVESFEKIDIEKLPNNNSLKKHSNKPKKSS